MMVLGGYHIYVGSTVQSTELINIEFYTKHVRFTDEVLFLLSQENKSSKAWFPYNRWRSFTIAGITSKLFSDRNNHIETKFLFCQRSLMTPRLPTIAEIESESISTIIAIMNDRQRLQRINGNHQCSYRKDCSDRNDRNDLNEHMEIIEQRLYVSCNLSDPSDYMEINLQQSWRSQRSNVFSDCNNPNDRNDRQRSYGN